MPDTNTKSKPAGQCLVHGDRIEMNISGAIFKGHIETRTLGQWPCKEESLFVVVNDPIRPHFPIALSDFLSYYGTVTKLS